MRVRQKTRVLVFVEYYLPGYKAGGPLRTIANMVEAIGERFDFFIITRDHDDTDSTPYSTIEIDQWNLVGRGHVFYASQRSLSYANLVHIIEEVAPDIIYLNSFFSQLTRRYLLLRRLDRIKEDITTIIAPRGEFSPGALKLKALKKRSYIKFTSVLGLYDRLIWHASSEREQDEICLGWQKDINIVVASNVLVNVPSRDTSTDLTIKTKESGHVRFVFLSRITPKKNLVTALDLLQSISGFVEFAIYGPIHEVDIGYWQICQQRIRNLPSNVSVQYHGAIPYLEVLPNLQSNHFFLFPTLGENFGHVIIEALAAGCPVLISDQTFWQDLHTKGVGWDIPLENREEWQKTVQICIDMGADEYTKLSKQAKEFHQTWVSDKSILQPTIDMFDQALEL